MTDEDWAREDTRALAVFLNGREIDEQDAEGREIRGHSFLLLASEPHTAEWRAGGGRGSGMSLARGALLRSAGLVAGGGHG